MAYSSNRDYTAAWYAIAEFMSTEEKSTEEKQMDKVEELQDKLKHEKAKLKVIERLKKLGIDIELLKEILKD